VEFRSSDALDLTPACMMRISTGTRLTARLVPSCAALLASFGIAAAQAPGAPNPLAVPPNDIPVAFVNVNVIPMDTERVLAAQTVVVSGGRIAQLGPTASVQVPAGAAVVDGAGKYLLPGFADMHGHLQAGAGTLDDPAGQQLALTLAHGVTLFRSMAGAPTGVALRERVKAGDLLGPELVIFSPSLNGNSVRSPAQGVTLVETHRQAGVDGLKTHGGFASRETYDSIVAAARRAGLKLAGHVTPESGLMRAVEAGQQIEHLDGFLQELLPAGYNGPQFGQLIADPAVLAQLDTARIPALARTMAERGIWNGPTLALFETIVSDSTAEQLLARPNMRYVSQNVRRQWPLQLQQQRAQMGTPEGRAAFVRIRNRIVQALDAAGAHLLVGSDSPQFFIVPGDAVHREMAAFVRAGVTPFGALVAATRAPAEYLGRADLGTVAAGKSANLVLLEGNPLQDIHQTRQVGGVMVQGRWIDPARVRALLDAVAAKHGA
jgi:imidazolonepropionase-like amidohydrolase